MEKILKSQALWGFSHFSLSSFCFGQIDCVPHKSLSLTLGTLLVELEELLKIKNSGSEGV